MKILHVITHFYPEIGGLQTYCEDFSMSFSRQGLKIIILTYDTRKTKRYHDYFNNIEIYRIPCFVILRSKFALPNPISLLKILYHFYNQNIDIVMTHMRFNDSAWWAWLYGKVIHAKSFLVDHTAFHARHPSKIVELTAKIVDHTIGKFSLNRYDKVICISQATLQFLRNDLKIKREIEIIHAGIDISEYNIPVQKNRNIPNTVLNLKKDDILISFVGRLIEVKGIKYFLEAAKILINKDKKYHFVFAGYGEMDEYIKNFVSTSNLESNIHIIGSLTHKEVITLLKNSNIYINPTYSGEGLQITILEAIASECYILTTKVGGIEEVLNGYAKKEYLEIKNTEDIVNKIENYNTKTKFNDDINKVLQDFDLEKNTTKYLMLMNE